MLISKTSRNIYKVKVAAITARWPGLVKIPVVLFSHVFQNLKKFVSKNYWQKLIGSDEVYIPL